MATTTTASNDSPGIGPKKSFLIMVTVVGCIAILWPKVFYPMMFGQPPKPIKDYRSGTGVRQERPPHLRPDGIHPAMRERGRAIPNAPTVPVVSERSQKPPAVAPRVVEGRPGPIPGMRPPMGAGSVHQATPKGNSMGFIMPLYTIGIVAFFIYTIMKLVFKKTEPPYGEPTKPNPDFTKQVFGQDKSGQTITNLGWPNGIHKDPIETLHAAVANGTSFSSSSTVMSAATSQIQLLPPSSSSPPSNSELEYQLRETEQLLEISLLKKKLLETEKAMSKIISEMATIPRAQNTTEQNGDVPSVIQNGHTLSPDQDTKTTTAEQSKPEISEAKIESVKKTDITGAIAKKRDRSNDRSVKVLGMEMTTSCIGGQKWNVPIDSGEKKSEREPEPEPQSIFLEGNLSHESQILVSDSETTAEEVFDDELNGTDDEPAVVLSSKMTLSLINLDPLDKTSASDTAQAEEESSEEELISEEENEDIAEEEIDENEADEEYEESDDDKANDKNQIKKKQKIQQNGVKKD